MVNFMQQEMIKCGHYYQSKRKCNNLYLFILAIGRHVQRAYEMGKRKLQTNGSNIFNLIKYLQEGIFRLLKSEKQDSRLYGNSTFCYFGNFSKHNFTSNYSLFIRIFSRIVYSVNIILKVVRLRLIVLDQELYSVTKV